MPICLNVKRTVTMEMLKIVLELMLLTLVVANKKSYRGDKVLRVYLSNMSDLESVITSSADAFKQNQVNIWSVPLSAGDPVDIHVSAMYFNKMTGLLNELHVDYVVLIDDIQSLADEQADFESNYNLRDLNRSKRGTESCENERDDDDPQEIERYDDVPRDVIGRFANISETYAWLTKLDDMFDIVSTEVIGKTYEGRDIMIIKVGHHDPAQVRTAVYMDAAIHAREWIAPAVINYFIYKLVKSYEDRNEDRMLVENIDWFFLPVVNPDGYQYTFDSDRLWRKNRSWHPSNGYGRNYSPCIGTDINRNFPLLGDYKGWRFFELYPCYPAYRGPEVASEKETQAIMDFLLSHNDSIKTYVSLHSYSQLVMTRWSQNGTIVPENDEEGTRVGEKITNAINAASSRTYLFGRGPELLYEFAGGSSDWAKFGAGIQLSYSVELPDKGHYGFFLPAEFIVPVGEEIWAGFTALGYDIINQTSYHLPVPATMRVQESVPTGPSSGSIMISEPLYLVVIIASFMVLYSNF